MYCALYVCGMWEGLSVHVFVKLFEHLRISFNDNYVCIIAGFGLR